MSQEDVMVEEIPNEKKDFVEETKDEPQVLSKDKRVWVSKKRMEELTKKAEQTAFYLDHLQRLQAEFENYRKRNLKEREELRKIVLEDFILELLNLMDNFDRAMETVGKAQNLETFQSGLAMIYRQFMDCLNKRGVVELNAIGQPFDPQMHDAVAHEESKDIPPHQVLSQLTKGYMLQGKIIRPCRVTVSKEPLQSPPPLNEPPSE